MSPVGAGGEREPVEVARIGPVSFATAAAFAEVDVDVPDWVVSALVAAPTADGVRELVGVINQRSRKLAELRAKVAAVEALAARVEYGHQTEHLGWLPEHRGIKYATHQRTVHYRIDEPVTIDHWTYADHRHPVEGCTAERHDLTTEAAVRPVLDGRSS